MAYLERKSITLSFIFFVFGALAGLVLNELNDYWTRTRPAIPDAVHGLVVQLQSHGAIFYVSQGEALTWYALQIIFLATVLGILASLSVAFFRGRNKSSDG